MQTTNNDQSSATAPIPTTPELRPPFSFTCNWGLVVAALKIASKDDMRPSINGVTFRVNKKSLTLFATDGRRMVAIKDEEFSPTGNRDNLPESDFFFGIARDSIDRISKLLPKRKASLPRSSCEVLSLLKHIEIRVDSDPAIPLTSGGGGAAPISATTLGESITYRFRSITTPLGAKELLSDGIWGKTSSLSTFVSLNLELLSGFDAVARAVKAAVSNSPHANSAVIFADDEKSPINIRFPSTPNLAGVLMPVRCDGGVEPATPSWLGFSKKVEAKPQAEAVPKLFDASLIPLLPGSRWIKKGDMASQNAMSVSGRIKHPTPQDPKTIGGASFAPSVLRFCSTPSDCDYPIINQVTGEFYGHYEPAETSVVQVAKESQP